MTTTARHDILTATTTVLSRTTTVTDTATVDRLCVKNCNVTRYCTFNDFFYHVTGSSISYVVLCLLAVQMSSTLCMYVVLSECLRVRDGLLKLLDYFCIVTLMILSRT